MDIMLESITQDVVVDTVRIRELIITSRVDCNNPFTATLTTDTGCSHGESLHTGWK